jgi:hypothetical protein
VVIGSVQHKADLHVDTVLNNLAVVDNNFLVLDPSALNAPDGLAGALDAFFDSIIKTFAGTGGYFTYFCDSHINSSVEKVAYYYVEQRKDSVLSRNHFRDPQEHGLSGLFITLFVHVKQSFNG